MSNFHSCTSEYSYIRLGWDPNLAFLPYGPRFRKHRKLLQSHFSENGQAKFQPIQLQNACLLAQGLMENTKGYQHLLSRYLNVHTYCSSPLTQSTRYTTAIVIRIAYGHQILSYDDMFVQTVHDCGYTLNNGGPPGGTVVDFFPIRTWVPCRNIVTTDPSAGCYSNAAPLVVSRNILC